MMLIFLILLAVLLFITVRELQRPSQDSAPLTLPCPQCQHQVLENYLLCPQCLTTLQGLCSSCHQTIKLLWDFCPFCGLHQKTREFQKTIFPFSSGAESPPGVPKLL